MKLLQTFLKIFIPAMEEGLTLGVPLAILLVILNRLPAENFRKNFVKAIKWGFWISIFVIAVRVGTRNAVSREMFEMISTLAAFIGEIAILILLFKRKFNRAFSIAISVTALTLFLYHGMELWLLPVGAVTSAVGDFSTLNFWTKISGFILGGFFSFLATFLIFKAADALNDQRLKFVFAVQIGACMIQQLLFLIQVSLARGFITNMTLFELAAPIIDRKSWLIFVIFAAVLVVPITLFSQPKPNRPENSNPAEYRLILSRAIHKRRWGFGVILSLALMVLSSTFGSYIANAKPEIVEAIPVEAVSGQIDVPLEKIQDGHLHRFVYRASEGEQVRFIVILKGGSNYGVGLDACDICGVTGYYERDNQVICKLCDVQMNKATIGTKGGCNPIPIEYSIAEGNLRVPQSELEKNARIFK